MKIMRQHDEDDTGSTATHAWMSRCRPLDDSDTSIITTTCTSSKRPCIDHNVIARLEDGHSEEKKCAMDTTMDDDVDTNVGNATATSVAIATLSPDEILIQMVQSGCYSQEAVVHFCISSGIPLSRMLRLDLMRLSHNNTNR